MTKSRHIHAPRHVWSDEERELLAAIYPHVLTEKIAKAFGLTKNQIYRQANAMGLKKSEAFYASEEAARLRGSVGTEHRFKPGHTTWNKGMKGLQLGNGATRFKPGNRTGWAKELHKPIGTERITDDGYLQRKINEDQPPHRRWRGVHLINWEAANGPIPQGHALVFRDGNKQNCAIENLELVTRAELMRRNTYHNLPKELAELVQRRGAITRQINRRSKEHVE